MNVQVVAATILYLSFSHLDHWPVALVKAYAEDCFGPKLWVDDERCKLLVDNLRFVHNNNPNTTSDNKEKGGETAQKNCDDDGDAAMEDASLLDDAALVAESYSKLQEFIAEDEYASIDNVSPLQQQQSQQQQRRGSLSSAGSAGVGPISHSASVTSLPRATSRDESDSAVAKGKKKDNDNNTNGDKSNKKKDKKKVATKASKNKPPKVKREDDDDGGSSSSSGEEDEEVIVTTKSAGEDPTSPKKAGDDNTNRPASPTASNAGSETGTSESISSSLLLKRRLYPLEQQKLNLARVRRRYFGVNQQNAYDAISSSLSARLDMKAKQNSALLQSLHSFTSIPAVRSIVSGNLEKWLQSPGLSGLARTLFTSTVKQIENVDPPLPADMEAIQKILSMRLKANQLSAHIENITAIATTVPTGSVAQVIYHQLLSEILATLGRGANASASDHLKMAGAVYSVMPKNLSSDGIAASLLLMIGNSTSVDSASSEQNRRERRQLVKHLKHVLHLVAQQLGATFDVCTLLESLLSYNIKDESWNVHDEEDRARLVFQCILLLVPAPPKEAGRNLPKAVRSKVTTLSPADTDSLKSKLSAARKLVLSWFCSDYGPQVGPSANKQSADVVGAGTPDYSSAIGGVDGNKRNPEWLTLAKCLLFMEDADSPQMQQFVRGANIQIDNDPTWYDEKYRIDRCCEYGCDFDDEMMWIILKAAALEDGGISSEMALTLIEHLFECCGVNRCGTLKVSDIMLAWELYSLVVYEPPETVVVQRGAANAESDDQFDDADESGDDSQKDVVRIDTADLDLPQ